MPRRPCLMFASGPGVGDASAGKDSSTTHEHRRSSRAATVAMHGTSTRWLIAGLLSLSVVGSPGLLRAESSMASCPSQAAGPGGVGTRDVRHRCGGVRGHRVRQFWFHALGANAMPRRVSVERRSGFVGFMTIALTLAYVATSRASSPTNRRPWFSTAAAGVGVAALGTGFCGRMVSSADVFRRARAGRGDGLLTRLYLTFALGPAAWARASNLPEEQILLALALCSRPSGWSLCSTSVASLGLSCSTAAADSIRAFRSRRALRCATSAPSG